MSHQLLVKLAGNNIYYNELYGPSPPFTLLPQCVHTYIIYVINHMKQYVHTYIIYVIYHMKFSKQSAIVNSDRGEAQRIFNGSSVFLTADTPPSAGISSP